MHIINFVKVHKIYKSSATKRQTKTNGLLQTQKKTLQKRQNSKTHNHSSASNKHRMEACSPCRRRTGPHRPRRDRSTKTGRPRRVITKNSRRKNGCFKRNRLETRSKRQKENCTSPQRRKTSIHHITNFRRRNLILEKAC